MDDSHKNIFLILYKKQARHQNRFDAAICNLSYHMNNWPFAHFYENKLFNSNRLSNFVSIAFGQGSKGNSKSFSEGVFPLGSAIGQDAGNQKNLQKAR